MFIVVFSIATTLFFDHNLFFHYISGQELHSVKQINSGINQIKERRTMSAVVYSEIN